MTTPIPILVCLNEASLALANRIKTVVPTAQLHGLGSRVDQVHVDAVFDDTMRHIADLFLAGHPVIGLCSSGILIRSVAPFVQNKQTEPPVLAVSPDGTSVVPLLGGHHGANTLANQIATALQGRSAITTATGMLALDQPPTGYRLVNPENAKAVMARLANGARAVIDPVDTPFLQDLPKASKASTDDCIYLTVTDKPVTARDAELVYAPQRYVLGIGCARGTAQNDIADVAQQVMEAANICPHAVACIATIDLKADEAGINAYARTLGVPVHLFDAQTLEAQTPHVSAPSEVVFGEVGCHSVSEAAALCAAGTTTLTVNKHKNANATAALARVETSIIGRPRGHLAIVGIGPGQSSWRTPEVSQLIMQADELVGYTLYLDLLGPLAQSKQQKTFPLGAETDRCRYALEQAGAGKRVALVCSGDAGIYAMASLVYEVLDTDATLNDAARRTAVYVSPGISALQAASARVGAPLGHDFCTISLSDLLTPWETIQQRVQGAAHGDFVIAFYNPVSQKRRTQLAWAKDCLLQHRPANTPVMLARSLGRPDETVDITTLDALQVDDVDMMTVVLVGSSQTRTLPHDGGLVAYTPRGYSKLIGD